MNRVTITASAEDTTSAILELTDAETAIAQKTVAAFEKEGTFSPTITIEVKEIK